jgi:hypothetical protein
MRCDSIPPSYLTVGLTGGDSRLPVPVPVALRRALPFA